MTNLEKVDLFKQLRKSEYSQPKRPALIEVDEGYYLTIDGDGEPGSEQFSTKVGALYAVAYTIKMTRKSDGHQDYVVGKLEGQWWSDRGVDLKNIPKQEWCWKLMIRIPDFVTHDELEQAVRTLSDKGKDPAVNKVKLERLKEGTCVQMLHIGSFEQEWESISQMLDFARKQGYESHGHHHEIYISDPRRVPPERLKTVLRMPVRNLG
jgi:hypothetical protein